MNTAITARRVHPTPQSVTEIGCSTLQHDQRATDQRTRWLLLSGHPGCPS
jgi:hypothetical protein